jgi:hypothetical protein
MTIEGIAYLAIILAAFAYPLFMEDHITWRTWLFALIAALFAPIALLVFILNHKNAIAQRQLQRTRDRMKLERRVKGE